LVFAGPRQGPDQRELHVRTVPVVHSIRGARFRGGRAIAGQVFSRAVRGDRSWGSFDGIGVGVLLVYVAVIATGGPLTGLTNARN
jgi:hypothetical protein